MKLFIVQSSLASLHFLSLRSKYSPQQPGPITVNLRSLLSIRDEVTHPFETACKIVGYEIPVTVTLSFK
jgi:hypothetical protein